MDIDKYKEAESLKSLIDNLEYGIHLLDNVKKWSDISRMENMPMLNIHLPKPDILSRELKLKFEIKLENAKKQFKLL